MLVALFSIVVGLFLILTIILLLYSPGKIELYLDAKSKPISGSISEKIFVEIGGIQQGMIIKSKNINRPVLINYCLISKHKPGLEDCFTVCYWEQRGGGLS